MSDDIWADFLNEHLRDDQIPVFGGEAAEALRGARKIEKEKKRKQRAISTKITVPPQDAGARGTAGTDAPVQPASRKPTINRQD